METALGTRNPARTCRWGRRTEVKGVERLSERGRERGGERKEVVCFVLRDGGFDGIHATET